SLASRYDFATPVTTDLMLYGKWTAVYTVSFDSNGGTEVDEQTVAEGESASKPVDPTRIGYTFAGWYRDSTLTQPYDFSTAVTGSFGLYANWTTNSYTVTFNSNGGTEVERQTVAYNNYASAPAAPTRAGYTFDGWYSDSGYTSSFEFASTQITTDTMLYRSDARRVETETLNRDRRNMRERQREVDNNYATGAAAQKRGG